MNGICGVVNKLNWITDQIGIKSVKQNLKESEYGAIIIDLRNIKDDGTNDQNEVYMTLQKIFKVVTNRDAKVILQCDGGISRSPVFMAAILVMGTQMSWDDAIDFVKKKNPETQINQDLLDTVKKVLNYITKGH
jgi:hypothetical protein